MDKPYTAIRYRDISSLDKLREKHFPEFINYNLKIFKFLRNIKLGKNLNAQEKELPDTELSIEELQNTMHLIYERLNYTIMHQELLTENSTI